MRTEGGKFMGIHTIWRVMFVRLTLIWDPSPKENNQNIIYAGLPENRGLILKAKL